MYTNQIAIGDNISVHVTLLASQVQCHRLKEYIFHFFAFWLISCEP